jgi:hypothetical protein
MRTIARSFTRNIILALAATTLLGAVAYAAEPAQEDPAAVAATLEKQAADFRAAADRHDAMAKAHRGGGGSSKVNHEGIVQHCNTIAKNLREAAKESEALAAEYRKKAAK